MSSINSRSHLIGRRRYATDDESRNHLFLTLTIGEDGSGGVTLSP